MRIKGIVYDCGLEYWPGQKLREISEEQMKKEFELIEKELNCNAIALQSSLNERLIKGVKVALETGLEVWVVPRYFNKSIEETLELLKSLVKELKNFEKERVVLCVGDVISLAVTDFFPGKLFCDRVRSLRIFTGLKSLYFQIMGEESEDWYFRVKDKDFLLKNFFESFVSKKKVKEMEWLAKEIGKEIKNFNQKFDEFMNKLLKVGKEFGGKLTYCAGDWEEVDWGQFDLISLSYFLSCNNWFTYAPTLKMIKEKFGKPLVVMEFGGFAFRYSSMFGANGWSIFDRFEVERSEEEQAEHIERQFKLMKKAGVDGCFCFTFLDVPEKVHVENPSYYKEDLDMGGAGIMKLLPNNTLQPKKAFFKLKELYSQE